MSPPSGPNVAASGASGGSPARDTTRIDSMS
jgi:hypothetical protein